MFTNWILKIYRNNYGQQQDRMQVIIVFLNFYYLYTNFMCFWWGNFHFFNRKWCIGFPQYCCFAFNNLQAEQRKREWHLQSTTHRFSHFCMWISSSYLGEMENYRQNKKQKQTNQPKQNKKKSNPKHSVNSFFPPPSSRLSLFMMILIAPPLFLTSLEDHFCFVGLLVGICVFLETAHWMMPYIRLWRSLRCLELPVSGTDRIAKNGIQSLMQEYNFPCHTQSLSHSIKCYWLQAFRWHYFDKEMEANQAHDARSLAHA